MEEKDRYRADDTLCADVTSASIPLRTHYAASLDPLYLAQPDLCTVRGPRTLRYTRESAI